MRSVSVGSVNPFTLIRHVLTSHQCLGTSLCRPLQTPRRITRPDYVFVCNTENQYYHCFRRLNVTLGGGGVVVSALDFRSEGLWFDAQSLPSCCFLRRDTLPHIKCDVNLFRPNDFDCKRQC